MFAGPNVRVVRRSGHAAREPGEIDAARAGNGFEGDIEKARRRPGGVVVQGSHGGVLDVTSVEGEREAPAESSVFDPLQKAHLEDRRRGNGWEEAARRGRMVEIIR